MHSRYAVSTATTFGAFCFLVQFFRRAGPSDMTKIWRRFIVSFLFLNWDKLDGLIYDTRWIEQACSFYALLILQKLTAVSLKFETPSKQT